MQVKSKSEGQKKRKKRRAGITNRSPSIFPVPVVELYDNGQLYGYGCLLLYKVKAISLNTCKITLVEVFNKHPYIAPAFQTESSSVH